MGKHVKVRNNQSGEIIEIIVKDFSGRTIDRYKFNGNNSTLYGYTIENLFSKFGFRPIINIKDAVTIREHPKTFFNY